MRLHQGCYNITRFILSLSGFCCSFPFSLLQSLGWRSLNYPLCSQAIFASAGLDKGNTWIWDFFVPLCTTLYLTVLNIICCHPVCWGPLHSVLVFIILNGSVSSANLASTLAPSPRSLVNKITPPILILLGPHCVEDKMDLKSVNAMRPNSSPPADSNDPSSIVLRMVPLLLAKKPPYPKGIKLLAYVLYSVVQFYLL